MSGQRMDTAFRSLTRFSKSHQPGWVNGLTRGRGPVAETWLDEARCWWEQLRLMVAAFQDDDLAVPIDEAAFTRLRADLEGWIAEWKVAPEAARSMCLDKALASLRAIRNLGVPVADPRLCDTTSEIFDHLPHPEFQRLREAIRDRDFVEREDRVDLEPDPIPSDWPWWSQTVGRRGLLVGGIPRESTRMLIERSFGFGALSWFSIEDQGDDASRVVSRLEGGLVELVLLVHDPAAPNALQPILRVAARLGVAMAHIGDRAGVTRTRIAIERYLNAELPVT